MRDDFDSYETEGDIHRRGFRAGVLVGTVVMAVVMLSGYLVRWALGGR